MKKDIQPHEPLKANVDAALEAVHAQMAILHQGINGGVGPLTSSMDAHEVNKAIAVLEACVNAYTTEYAHMAELNAETRKQRDDLKRKLESLKRLFNRGLSDDDDKTDDSDKDTDNDSGGGGKGRKK